MAPLYVSPGHGLDEIARSRTGLLSIPYPHESRLRYVPYAPDVWCPLLRSRELKTGSIRCAELLGQKLAVFRAGDGSVAALVDRCPHRGVALSLGRVCGTVIQCAYHGWKVDGSGRVVSAPGLAPGEMPVRTEGFALHERLGVIWAFVGAREDADSNRLPDLAPYGTQGATDILVRKDIRAHWSFVLDNAVDLFHQHLHRDIAFFFRIEALEGFAGDGERFDVRYRAVMASAYGRRRRGELRVQVSGNVTTLDLNGFPIIHAVATPHSADGRRQTLWWFIACPGSRLHRLLAGIVLPYLRRCISRGFDQDVTVLESEQRAFDDGLRIQKEMNPAVVAAHRHLNARILEGAKAKVRDARSEPVNSGQLVREARNGGVTVLVRSVGRFELTTPDELERRIGQAETVQALRHSNIVVVCLD